MIRIRSAKYVFQGTIKNAIIDNWRREPKKKKGDRTRSEEGMRR